MGMGHRRSFGVTGKRGDWRDCSASSEVLNLCPALGLVNLVSWTTIDVCGRNRKSTENERVTGPMGEYAYCHQRWLHCDQCVDLMMDYGLAKCMMGCDEGSERLRR